MEQPPEEAPEVREEEEKEEVAETQGAAELNGEPEHSLPSSSYTGEEGGAGAGPQPRGVGARGAAGGLEPQACGQGHHVFLYSRQDPRGGEWALGELLEFVCVLHAVMVVPALLLQGPI